MAQGGPAQSRARTGTIDGIVSDTALAPIADVTVSVLGSPLRVVTGGNGRFRMLGVPAGEYLLLVRRLGFEGATTKVVVDQDSASRIAITLVPVATRLAGVEVFSRPPENMRMKEFNERRERGEGGTFFTRADIVKRNPALTLDLFRAMPSLKMPDGDIRGPSGVFSTRSNCELPILVDGLPVRAVDVPPPEMIAGIEVYSGPATVPLQYKSTRRGSTGGLQCGLILIWTGDGR